MPKIGMRIIKTCIAVYICFLIYLLRGEQGAPFYSAIAAILCMQPYVSNSVKVAMNRTIGTFIGGGMGMIILSLEQYYLFLDSQALMYLVVSLAIIPIIYFTVMIKKPTVSYITCVVFLSVTVAHGQDVNPGYFAMDRILDTLIGIFVSLGVNTFHIPKKKNQRILFISDLDGTLLNDDNKISIYSKIKLDRMLNHGMLFSMVTNRSVSNFGSILEGVDQKLPIIMMDGAALYDLKKKSYLDLKPISYDIAYQVLNAFKEQEMNSFSHAIVNDILHIYYATLINPVEEEIYHVKKFQPQKNYVCSDLPKDQDVLVIKAIDQLEYIKKLEKRISQLECAATIRMSVKKDKVHEGYYYLEVYSSVASIKKAVMKMKKLVLADTVVAFGNDSNNIPLLEVADYGYAVENATPELLENAPLMIDNNNSDAVVKTIEKFFYSNNKKLENKIELKTGKNKD